MNDTALPGATTPEADLPPAQQLARAVVRALVAGGVRDAVLAPGSRSAPLAYALLEAETAGALRLHVVVDERSAGFVALGLAADTGRPVPVVVTSGSAVANLHPAVVEAGHQRAPLVVVSCDRPAELVRRGASQTTEHVGMFGEGPGLSRPRASAEVDAAYQAATEVSRLVRAAVGSARRADPPTSGAVGPVHLNVVLADPLVPDPGAAPPVLEPGRVPGGWSSSMPHELEPAGRTVLLAADGAGWVGHALTAQGRWPVLAEPSAGVDGAHALAATPALLDALGSEIDRVVVVGRPTLSRQVTRLLAREDLEVVVLDPRGRPWLEVPGAVHVPAAEVVPPDDAPSAADDPAWSAAWAAAGAAVQRELDTVSREARDGVAPLGGDVAARAVAAAVAREDGLLVAGASMAIRYLDLAGIPGAPVVASRGVAGIDGTLSTALGRALARTPADGRGPVRALVGDLTFQHDVGGLVRGRLERDVDLQVVVLADDGGSIFGTLEHGRPEHAAAHERVFATPQTIDIGALARGAGVAHTVVGDLAGLEAALAAPVRGRCVLEVRLDRHALREDRAALHARLVAVARDAVGD
ncbi:2-succinyl-5-enolpyruvyl-6-hydroxy-3-cyclohexene-1-carboxylic-acid synthase [Litorihabitans aurantiacus]|uniref:2-succinyl-5-enolpyruvyl-6-hydroxy-3-cyclohexene-1-carboxylate synthase n=1 Tax=Litorihabitans aurantiacus TaxID=1930061 RepID=A0AA38CQN4_9MICO|nr:2-succinyl-5-enolpyruvyl-6-hydroxy-3-cyclohexene-1-carboxylic-acid synthase [Litorihabitans aurantiacus]GMA32393.1 2-succinyl-5-enolpyruvyl-6-hydroxy-3-cyclohexene- 1-carboxylate synthase [Litorihabitans aurantiacus]